MARVASTRSARSSKKPRGERRTGPRPVRLGLAVTCVFGSTKAFASHGDAATLAVVLKHHEQIAAAARTCGARIVKYLGDGALLTFPEERGQAAVSALRELQAEGTRLWAAFDPVCSVRVKVGAGSVIAGMFGSGDTARYDVYGLALNLLIKAPWEPEVNVLPEVSQS